MAKLRGGYIYLLIFAIVSVGALIANGRPQPPEPITESAISYYFLFPISPQEITGLELIVPEEDIDIVVSLDDNNQWRLLTEELPFVDPSQPEAARLLVTRIVGMQEVPREGKPMEEFGFLPFPKYVVRFQLNRVISGQNRFTFMVGEKTPQGNAYYVAANLDSTIIDVVPTELIDNLVMVMTQLEPTMAPLAPTPSAVP